MSEPPRPVPFTESEVDWQEARGRLRDRLRQQLQTATSPEIEDLTQEAVVRLLRTVRRQGVDHPRALIATIAERTAIDFIRSRTRWALILRRASSDSLDHPDPHDPTTEIFGDPEARLQFIVSEFFKTRKSGCSDLAAAFFARRDWKQVAGERHESHAAIRQRWARCVELLRKAAASDPHLALLAEWARR